MSIGWIILTNNRFILLSYEELMGLSPKESLNNWIRKKADYPNDQLLTYKSVTWFPLASASVKWNTYEE